MITYEELKGFNFNTKNISNVQLSGKCVKCNNSFKYSSVKKFLRNRKDKTHKQHLWESCPKCWLLINTKECQEWIKKQSEVQKVTQNKPEQKIKNSKGVAKSWTEKRRKEASEYLKSRMQTDKDFRKKAFLNLKHDTHQMRIGFGKPGLKGEYNGINYDSALELSFIIWCCDQKIPIKRFNLEPVEYIDEENISRKYYPDFIINNNEIVEIKGTGLWYSKNYERNIRKISAAKKIFDSYYIIFEKDDILKKNYNKARKIHHETYSKKNL